MLSKKREKSNFFFLEKKEKRNNKSTNNSEIFIIAFNLNHIICRFDFMYFFLFFERKKTKCASMVIGTWRTAEIFLE